MRSIDQVILPTKRYKPFKLIIYKNLMTLETCSQHNLFINYICAKGECNQLICP